MRAGERVLIVKYSTVEPGEMRIFVGIRVIKQDALLVARDVLMLIRVFHGDEFFVAFEAFVQGVLFVAAASVSGVGLRCFAS